MDPEKFVLEKRMWTEQDYEKMGWHDVRVHAISLNPYRHGDVFSTVGELMLDIDYILKWVLTPEKHYRFWVAPATLVFHNVVEFTMHHYSPDAIWEIDDLEREEVESPTGKPLWLWRMWHDGLTFKSTGYSQYIRRDPVLQDQQEFSLSQRGGISFEAPIQKEFES